MRKFSNIIFTALIAMLFVCTGCKKEENVNPPADEKEADEKEAVATAADFAGPYDLTIDWAAYMDGQYDEEGTYVGTLTITATGEKTVEVLGEVSLRGVEVPLYSTTGEVDEKGVLRLEGSTYTAGGSTFDITYDDIKLKSPLKFNSEMRIVIEGYEVVYEMTNTATMK